MLKCNAEIMKDLKQLEEDRKVLLKFESENKETEYELGETPLRNPYDYDEVKRKIDFIDQEMRRLKAVLAYSNITTKVDGFDITISDALVWLDQLKKKAQRLSSMANAGPLSRVGGSYNDHVYYRKTNYDPQEVKKDYEEVKKIIPKLQMAIDRTNLTNMIEC